MAYFDPPRHIKSKTYPPRLPIRFEETTTDLYMRGIRKTAWCSKSTAPARNRNADSEDDGNLHIFPQDILNIHLDASRRNSTIDLIVIDRSPLSAAIQDSASQPLMLCSVNVRLAKSKSADFLDYIHTSGADLFAFTETWLTANDTAAKLELIPPETHNFVHHNRSGRKVGELVCSSDKTLAEEDRCW